MTPSVPRRRVLTALAAGAGALAVGSLSRPAWAHRAHVSLTRVLGNPRAGTWEFLHSIHIHDAITALDRAVKAGEFVYFVDFRNIGGLVSPLPLTLTYAD
ncbi:MAG: DUF6702 family protein, partial [Gammaproteobacteria bacterium]